MTNLPGTTDRRAHAPPEAIAGIGDADAAQLLADLVAIAPVNLEDPLHGRYEKPNYRTAAERIARAARGWGLSASVVEASALGVPSDELPGGPRPNVVVDLDVGAETRTLLLAHFDVVPVPAEQRARWKTPPHELTPRDDGRLYGRGADDDLGSGVVASLLAMRRLKLEGGARSNVRLLACCDEETGGAGGIEAFKLADERGSSSPAERYLSAEVALIPDGSPHTTAASSGLIFLDVRFGPTPLALAVELGQTLVDLQGLAAGWLSVYPSEDWPDHGAPSPYITGRASVTKLDWSGHSSVEGSMVLRSARAETDAANQVAAAVTLVFATSGAGSSPLSSRLSPFVAPPYRLSDEIHSSLVIPSGMTGVQLIGESTHGGYPHRGHNPVPAALNLVRQAGAAGVVDPRSLVDGTFSVDVRLPPEMDVEDGKRPVLERVRAWLAAHQVPGDVEAPAARCRSGYALPIDHPQLLKLQAILAQTMGSPGIYGEYGGTDASSLSGLRTPSGAVLPAIVFGSMDRSSHIHEAEESVDPALLRAVAESIVRFVRAP